MTASADRPGDRHRRQRHGERRPIGHRGAAQRRGRDPGERLARGRVGRRESGAEHGVGGERGRGEEERAKGRGARGAAAGRAPPVGQLFPTCGHQRRQREHDEQQELDGVAHPRKPGHALTPGGDRGEPEDRGAGRAGGGQPPPRRQLRAPRGEREAEQRHGAEEDEREVALPGERRRRPEAGREVAERGPEEVGEEQLEEAAGGERVRRERPGSGQQPAADRLGEDGEERRQHRRRQQRRRARGDGDGDPWPGPPPGQDHDGARDRPEPGGDRLPGEEREAEEGAGGERASACRPPRRRRPGGRSQRPHRPHQRRLQVEERQARPRDPAGAGGGRGHRRRPPAGAGPAREAVATEEEEQVVEGEVPCGRGLGGHEEEEQRPGVGGHRVGVGEEGPAAVRVRVPERGPPRHDLRPPHRPPGDLRRADVAGGERPAGEQRREVERGPQRHEHGQRQRLAPRHRGQSTESMASAGAVTPGRRAPDPAAGVAGGCGLATLWRCGRPPPQRGPRVPRAGTAAGRR